MILKHIIVAVMAIFTLSACSTMAPSTYAPNADSNVALRNLTGTKVIVVSMQDNSKFDANCRLMGPIQASNNRSVPAFVKDSFNDEFKFANIYSEDQDATKLEATMEKVAYSSMSGLTNGWWDLRVKLKNAQTGDEVVSDVHYTFKSGFDAITACNQSAQAMMPAVQQLIKEAVMNSKFQKLAKSEKFQ